jgi:choline dehydrogenase-like flavoprotein
MNHYDVIVVGSGVGGGMVARRLSEAGAKVLLLERGQPVPREDSNWSVEKVFFQKIYKSRETWLDQKGSPFDPGMYYNVGGMTKFYGGAMFRLREQDFEDVEHAEGLSPSWPITYSDLAPYYQQAERLFRVHGDESGDKTAPQRTSPFPFQAVESSPDVARMAKNFQRQGLSPSALPLAVFSAGAGNCILCKTCDGFPCRIGQKGDAEQCGVVPALATGNTTLLTGAFARRLILSPDARKITGVEVERDGEVTTFVAPLIVVSCNAVNSAALLLRSATTHAESGASNSSGVVGRNYMTHNQSAVMGVSHRVNTSVFQKTIAINDWYFGDNAFPWPMGQLQMLGKLQGGMLSANIPLLPKWFSNKLAQHSMDFIALSEDLPDPDNRVTLDGGTIKLSVKLNNMQAHRQLLVRAKKALRAAGYPVILTKSLFSHSTVHQCGTVRMGNDPSKAAIDGYCRSFDHDNLFVVDASFFPSSAAVNPALTIAAQALRSADHILKKDFHLTA